MAIDNLRTPVGRIVWGNPAKSQPKKSGTPPVPVLKDGKPVEQWAFGVAFSKAEFDAYLKPAFDAEARSAYPHGVPQNFSWKYKDGDGVDRTGKPHSAKEGWGGCYVVTVSTEAFAPPIYIFENGAYRQVQPHEIKTGDYVVLSLNIKVNVPTSPTHTPGLYVNPNGVELIGAGQAIQQSADPTEMFGGAQHQLPPGATPIQGGGYAPGGAVPGAPAGYPQQPQPAPYQPAPVQQPQPGYPQQPAPTGYAPQPAQQPVQQYQQPQPAYQPPQQPAPVQPAPAGYPAPAHDFVQNAAPAGYPQQPQPAPYQPAPAGYAPPQQPAPAGYPAQPGMMPPR